VAGAASAGASVAVKGSLGSGSLINSAGAASGAATADSGAKGMKTLGSVKVRKLKSAHGGHASTTSTIRGPNKRRAPGVVNSANIGLTMGNIGSTSKAAVGSKAAASAL
jgi:hypothetical protein